MSVLVEYQVERGVAVLMIQRPEARNALNWSAQEQFAAAVQKAAGDSTLRVLIITAAGDKAFVSGGDLKELACHPDTEAAERLNRVMGAALDQLIRLPAPVIAAVNGDAIGGGCEMITACDLRLVAESAHFRFAQVQVGLTTGWGGTARLVHLLGASRATELLLTGRSFDAAEAQAIGFVQRVVQRDQVMARALEWAEDLRALPKEALAASKRLIWESAGRSLEDAYQLERKLFIELWLTADHLEAVAAFNEKRRPHFGKT
jgi:enoyl-CoA hydratase/carnithine racemase